MEAKIERLPYRPRAGLLSRDVVCVDEEASLTEAARLMREHHIGDLVVVKNGRKPAGILTDRDLAIETFGQEVDGAGLRVADIMSADTATGLLTDDVFELIRKMKEAGVGRLPLLDDKGQVAGIITAKRLTRILLEGLNDLFEMSEQRKQKEYEWRS